MKLLSQIKIDEGIIYRRKELQEAIESYEKLIEEAPKGSIHVMKRGNYYEYYLRKSPKEKTGKYIKKSERELVSKIVQREYAEKALKLAKKEISNIDRIMKAADSAEKMKHLYSNSNPGIKKYIVPIDMSDEDYKTYWQKEEYIAKSDEWLNTEFYTENGEHVRSKSELLIANALKKSGIPYKYEKPMKMPNGKIYHPDFTLLEIRSRKELIWEHLGLIDKRSYIEDALERMEQYKKKGIYPGVEMIVTYETTEKPLSTRDIKEIIKRYFS